jgi:hypothetical protein
MRLSTSVVALMVVLAFAVGCRSMTGESARPEY